MKNKFKLLSFSVLLVTLFSAASCKKENNDVDKELVFSSLTSAKDTIIPGGSTEVYATADGDGIVFQWSASAGDITGSGATVTYISPPCVTGTNEVACTVKDKAGNKITKSVQIVVL
jgi:hypothetical protein